MDYKFKFRSLTQQEAKKVNFSGDNHRYITELDCDGVSYAKFLGNIITLFGQPLYKNPCTGILYSYLIEAKNPEGEISYLDLHSASGGPTVFCDDNVEACQAAEELIRNILNARPTDYEYDFIGDELSSIQSGVKNGKPYWKEKKLWF
jgi:hypothetical protein